MLTFSRHLTAQTMNCYLASYPVAAFVAVASLLAGNLISNSVGMQLL